MGLVCRNMEAIDLRKMEKHGEKFWKYIFLKCPVSYFEK